VRGKTFHVSSNFLEKIFLKLLERKFYLTEPILELGLAKNWLRASSDFQNMGFPQKTSFYASQSSLKSFHWLFIPATEI